MPAFHRLHRWRKRRPTNRPDSGFTLVELVVALLLLAILMSASLYAILQGLGLSRDSQERVVASNLISGVLEKLETSTLNSTGFNTVAASIGTTTLANQTVGNTTFHFTETNEWESRGATSSVCTTGTDTNLVLVVTVKATWGYGGEYVSESTSIAPPSGSAGTTGNGGLAVQVDQSDGTGFSGATVTTTNTTTNGTTGYTTGSDGCAFFDSLSPANYTVTVSSPGGVSIGEQSTYSYPTSKQSNLTVSAGPVNTTLVKDAIYYETGGTVTWSYTQPYSSTPLIPAEGMPTSIDNPSQGLSQNMYAYAAPPGAATSGTITPVYPNTYTIFAGGCTDADPDGQSTGGTQAPFYTNATPSAVVVTEGATSTASVPLYPLNLQIESASGSPLATAGSPVLSPPTALAGGAGICENQGAPTYTLNAVVLGVSSTAVGLGELQISASIVGQTSPATATVWVKPDGVYTTGGSLIYSFASCTKSPPSSACMVPVKV